jgi:DNA-binding transcriptional ArsR family regulator
MSEHTAVGSSGLMLTGASAALRSRLQALPWMVLEQLGFDAHLDSGRLVAASSARRIAEQLKVDPDAVAEALRVLRRAGIVDLVRPGTSGPAVVRAVRRGRGRFRRKRFRRKRSVGQPSSA